MHVFPYRSRTNLHHQRGRLIQKKAPHTPLQGHLANLHVYHSHEFQKHVQNAQESLARALHLYFFSDKRRAAYGARA